MELPEGQEPFAPCDGCGNFVCNGLDETICAPGVVNDCGGCERSTLAPGDPCAVCGVDGVVECDGTLTPACSTASEANACGGCATLDTAPGEPCGSCGQTLCASSDSVVCFDPCA